MLAKTFPSHHYLKGQPTDFSLKALYGEKIHTIRVNWPLWIERIDSVNNGFACISVREWSGKPYNSPQVELFKIYKCGYEHVVSNEKLFQVLDPEYLKSANIAQSWLAQNDGLNTKQFVSWFEKINKQNRLIIIHFTDFRYTGKVSTRNAESYLIPTPQSN